MEARANDVQLCLSERTFHTKHKAVVEIGWVVTAISIENQCVGDRAQLQQPMPILVRACQARGFQREDCTDMTHCHIADKSLEVVAMGRLLARVAEIPVEDPDLLWRPAERLRLVRQIVLTFRAFLIETDLAHRRLTNVDAGFPRQMMIGNLRVHHDQLLPGRVASRPQRDRIRSCWR
jgi:hypothetical protein